MELFLSPYLLLFKFNVCENWKIYSKHPQNIIYDHRTPSLTQTANAQRRIEELIQKKADP